MSLEELMQKHRAISGVLHYLVKMGVIEDLWTAWRKCDELEEYFGLEELPK